MHNSAPVTKVFINTPPSREEAPEGYITSACGNKHQRALALFFGVVAIPLHPSAISSDIVIHKGPLK